jgi:hypothetical protein
MFFLQFFCLCTRVEPLLYSAYGLRVHRGDLLRSPQPPFLFWQPMSSFVTLRLAATPRWALDSVGGRRSVRTVSVAIALIIGLFLGGALVFVILLIAAVLIDEDRSDQKERKRSSVTITAPNGTNENPPEEPTSVPVKDVTYH